MTTSKIRIGGVVLCGGRSRRMGRSKAWLPWQGGYLLPWVVRTVSEVVRPVVVAARPGQELPSLPDGVDVAFDAIEDGGPLAGVAAGFAALADRCDAVFVASCDQPFIKAAFIRRLTELLGEHPAVVVSHADRLHPLAAVYRLTTRQVLTEMAAQGELRAHKFAQRCNALVVTAAEFAEADPDLESLDNLNDPDTYDRAIQSQGS